MRDQLQMINRLKPKSEFSRNVLTLMTGTTIAQAIPIAISPILTRLYTPEDFGVFALFFAISSIFGSIANGRYELAIMLPKKDEDAINIFALGIIISFAISIFLLLVIFLFHDRLINLLGNKDISVWLYFVPVSVFFIGLFNALNYFNNRKKNYKDIANATIIKSIITAVIQLSLGLLKGGASGLISGQLISQIFANMRLIKNIINNNALISSITRARIIVFAKRYKDFPLHNAPATFADILTLQIPILLLPILFNVSVVGYFSLAKKIISMPSILISRSISQVLLEKITYNNNHNRQNGPILIKTIRKLFLIAFPISLLFYFFGTQIFLFIFGSAWALSGNISKYLSLIFLFQFTASTISVSLIAYKKLKILALWQYLYLFSSLILFAIVYKFSLGFNTFLNLFTGIEITFYILYFYISVSVVYGNDRKIGSE